MASCGLPPDLLDRFVPRTRHGPLRLNQQQWYMIVLFFFLATSMDTEKCRVRLSHFLYVLNPKKEGFHVLSPLCAPPVQDKCFARAFSFPPRTSFYGVIPSFRFSGPRSDQVKVLLPCKCTRFRRPRLPWVTLFHSLSGHPPIVSPLRP